MAEAQIVVDVQPSPLSESMQLEASPLSESSPLPEAPIVVDVHPSPLSESIQLESSPLSLPEAPIVVDVHPSPLSESIQLESSLLPEAPIVVDVHPSPLSESIQLESSPLPEAQIVVDVHPSPLSESIQLESSPLSEAPIVVDLNASLQHELDTLWGNANEEENFTIFRTPHNISQSKKNFFEPSVISIGPFHHGQNHLRAMEEQKMRFLRDFLSHGDHRLLDRCISEMKDLETSTRRCYSETFGDLDSNAFVKMMLLDGCFVFEYFSTHRNWNEVGWNCQFIIRDLLLQENQIPFFIVDKLYELIGLNQYDRMRRAKVIAFNLLPIGSIIQDPCTETPYTKIENSLAEFLDHPIPPTEIHHLVHLYYHYLVPNPGIPVVLIFRTFSANRIIEGLLHRFRSRVLRGRSPHSTSPRSSVPMPNLTGNISSMVIPSATELKQKGLKFTPKSNPKHMLDISFEYGVLKIPRLQISDDTKPNFANLIAFEHSKYGKKDGPFTSFLIFLDYLVNTPNDVTILQECGIIENWLGSEEELTHFINQVTEGAGFGKDHYLAELYMEVNKYIESSWHRHRAKLIRDYFSSPWAIISIIAAFILLVLTLVQSFFAVFSYFRPPSS